MKRYPRGALRGFVFTNTIVCLFSIVVVFIFAAGFTSCTNKVSHTHETKGDTKTIYYCPMHPTYTSDKPGRCPICGMDLVPMKNENNPQDMNRHEDMNMNQGGHGHGGEESMIDIPVERQKLIGIKTTKLEIADAIKDIRVFGKVAYDPGLAVAQTEYVEARKIKDKDLIAASHQRLALLGMSSSEIKKLDVKKNTDQNLYLPQNSAWVYATIYENELAFVSNGQGVQVELSSGQTVEGTIKSIDPVLDETTRTARVHILVSNKTKSFFPNMFVNARITKDLGKKLLIPKDALIDSGERKIAFMVHEGTQFMPQEVKLGAELSDAYVVESGLSQGDEVVTSANFLLDAESKLKSAIWGKGDHQH